MKNLIIILISACLFAIGVFFINQDTADHSATSISKKIEQDLKAALNQNFFPPTIQSVSKIRITIHSKSNAWKQKILSNIILPLDASPKGKYSLQIDAIENFTPSSEAILILQFNLFENLTRNKKWEGSRIYHLDKDDLAIFLDSSKN